MKKILIAFTMIISTMTGISQEVGVDPEFASYMVETERRTIFVQNMRLTDEQATIFWEIYDQFEGELKEVRESAIANLKKYGERYEKMTDEEAAEIMKLDLKNEKKRTAIRIKYFKVLTKKLGATIAARFIQLDEIISNVLVLSVYDELPLYGDQK